MCTFNKLANIDFSTIPFVFNVVNFRTLTSPLHDITNELVSERSTGENHKSKYFTTAERSVVIKRENTTLSQRIEINLAVALANNFHVGLRAVTDGWMESPQFFEDFSENSFRTPLWGDAVMKIGDGDERDRQPSRSVDRSKCERPKMALIDQVRIVRTKSTDNRVSPKASLRVVKQPSVGRTVIEPNRTGTRLVTDEKVSTRRTLDRYFRKTKTTNLSALKFNLSLTRNSNTDQTTRRRLHLRDGIVNDVSNGSFFG